MVRVGQVPIQFQRPLALPNSKRSSIGAHLDHSHTQMSGCILRGQGQRLATAASAATSLEVRSSGRKVVEYTVSRAAAWTRARSWWDRAPRHERKNDELSQGCRGVIPSKCQARPWKKRSMESVRALAARSWQRLQLVAYQVS